MSQSVPVIDGAARRAVRLADEDRARAAHARHDGRVMVGDAAAEHAETGRRRQPRGVEDVLGRERHAVERPEDRFAPPRAAVGGARLLDRALGGREDDGIEAGIDRVNVLEMRADDLERRELLLADLSRQPAGRRAYYVSHFSREIRRSASGLIAVDGISGFDVQHLHLVPDELLELAWAAGQDRE